jgi:hypothetical protein
MSGYFRGNWSTTSKSSISSSNITDPTKPNRHEFKQRKLDQAIKSDKELHEYDRICRVDPVTRQLVVGFTQMVTDRVNDGWSCHLMTFPFAQLPGARGAVIQAMKDEIQRV